MKLSEGSLNNADGFSRQVWEDDGDMPHSSGSTTKDDVGLEMEKM